nr:hypothetical protein [Paenibacillus ihbetae]
MRKLTMAVLLLILCMVVSACGGNNAGNANTGRFGGRSAGRNIRDGLRLPNRPRMRS